MRLLPENHIRWPIRGFTAIADKWLLIVTSRVFQRVRARGRADLVRESKANLENRR